MWDTDWGDETALSYPARMLLRIDVAELKGVRNVRKSKYKDMILTIRDGKLA
jgi:hypothetical protein